MKRTLRIKSEDEEYKPLKIYRKTVKEAKLKPSPQKLLFNLLELRIKNQVDGEAYFELLEEYLSRASKTSLDHEKLKGYISKIEAVGDYETLKLIKKIKLEALRDG